MLARIRNIFWTGELDRLVVDPVQDFVQSEDGAGVTTLTEFDPEYHQTGMRASAEHIADELQFGFCVLAWMTMRSSGSASQGVYTATPVLFPEVDVRPGLVVFSAGAADAIFCRMLYQGSPVGHVLRYVLIHEEYGLLSVSWCVVTQLYLMRPYSSYLFYSLVQYLL